MSASVCGAALFPIDVLRPDGSHLPFTRTCLIHLAFSALLFVSLIALFGTLSVACQRDEKWRPFSQTTRTLGLLFLVSLLALLLVPVSWRGLAQRAMGVPVLGWLLLTGVRLRQDEEVP
jgi:hypothetical protein